MLVYGDPQFTTMASDLLDRLGGALNFALQAKEDQLTGTRSWLIKAGQFEQAWFDSAAAGELPEVGNAAARLTDLAARWFLECWSAESSCRWQEGAGRELEGLTASLGRFGAADLRLTVKVPEGFECYALYPEQYAVTARNWARQHARQATQGRVVVIGIRSIGTSLSAVVSEVLRSEGWDVRRFTVRPGGPPFQRTVTLGSSRFSAGDQFIVVDEGPGLSGSSMAAVAEALIHAGVRPDSIAFFPGHGGEPGPAASEIIRSRWQSISRFWTPLRDLCWNSLGLVESLHREIAIRIPEVARGSVIEDVSGGGWRRLVFGAQGDWPAVAAPFERIKFCVAAEGRELALWKFAGLGAFTDADGSNSSTSWAQLKERAARGWGPHPLACVHGFVATPWMKGSFLTAADGADPAVVDRVADYLADVSRPGPGDEKQRTASARLADMLFHNVHETSGSELANATRPMAEAEAQIRWPAAHGDGRLEPHHWVRTPEREVKKVNPISHDVDHTLVGRQSVAWDVAGVLVEWRLEAAARSRLLARLELRGLVIDPRSLRFHIVAYAAFRMGMMTHCAGLAADSAERTRLHAARSCYLEFLRAAL